ncbi:MAG: DNA polymerase III subunit beta [Chloroflexi bacterium]|nr:MAG: DNA polymerase III subunit beta [Chloroflexota bacterium]
MTTTNVLINAVDTNAVIAAFVAPTAKTAQKATSLSLSCLRDNLKQAMVIVGHAVPGKATLPVLSNILFKASNSRLMVQATDMETAITVWVSATLTAEGATTLPAKLVSEFVGNLSNDAVTMTVDSKTETARIVCARSEANIKGIEAEEWPAVPSKGTDTVIEAIASGTLRQAIKQVVFAAGDDTSTKPVYQGVMVRFAPDKPIEFFATDGFRFAFKSVALDVATAKGITASHDRIILAKALMALDRALAVVDDEAAIRVSMTANGGQVIFAAETVEVVCRLMSGPHVPFERVLAVFKNITTTAVLDVSEFVRNTKQAHIFSAQSGYITKFTFQPVTAGVGTVTLTANASEAGDNKAIVDAQITGKASEFAASSKYILEALGVLLSKDTKVAFDVVSAAAPAMLRIVGDDSLKLIVMPMQIQN